MKRMQAVSAPIFKSFFASQFKIPRCSNVLRALPHALPLLAVLAAAAPCSAQLLPLEREIIARASLPDAPLPQSEKLSEAQATATDNHASLHGTVEDAEAAIIPEATVELLNEAGQVSLSVKTDGNGEFRFDNIAGGSYRIRASFPGFSRALSGPIILGNGQTLAVPPIVVQLPSFSSEITVRPTEVIAEEQMKAEEKQRAFGIFPEFYTSYVWNAAPLNTKQKFRLASRTTFDPTMFLAVSLGAGIQQAHNSYPEFGDGAEGYGKRWGALFALGRTSDLLSHAVFPSIFHQDPRYFYQGSGSVWSRTKHAIGSAVITRNDHGKNRPNYSHVLAHLASGGLSNLYYPAESRGADLVFENAAIGIGGRAIQNLLREFVNKHLTTNVRANGKPPAVPANP